MAITDSIGKVTGKYTSTMSTLNHYEKRVSGIINDPMSLLSNPSIFGSFSTSTLGKMLARPDPLLSFQWQVELPTLNLKKAYSLGPEYVESCSVVLPTFSSRSVSKSGRELTYPDVSVSHDTCKLTVYADINNNAFSYWNAWRSLVNPYPGAFGTPKPSKYMQGYSGYMQDVKLITKSPYNEDIFMLTYQNCWPLSIGMDELTSTGDRATFSVELAVNGVTIEGCNLDTITGTIQNCITGTINKIMSTAKDAVLGSAKNLAGQAGEYLSNTTAGQTVAGWFNDGGGDNVQQA